MSPGVEAVVDARMLTGQTREHLDLWRDAAGECLLHRAVIGPLRQLCGQAAAVGIELCVASGFRSFDRQLAIWNAKARGERPVLDEGGRPCAWAALDPRQRLHAILRWSALPGASRHHWGTDFDVWDRTAVAADYPLRLEPWEYAAGGPFHRLSVWLDNNLEGSTGFARPYGGGTGVAAEPWHLSYLPLAAGFERQLTPALLHRTLAGAALELRDLALAELGDIHARFVTTGRADAGANATETTADFPRAGPLHPEG